jgi:hypothetical protein
MITKENMEYVDWKVISQSENGFKCKKLGQVVNRWIEMEYTNNTEQVIINRVTKIKKETTKELMYQGICPDIESFFDVFRLHKYK